jgi:hypothetical protein
VTTAAAAVAPRFLARVAGAFYLVTILAGGSALMLRGRWGFAAGLIAAASYVAVTLLFYYLFRPVNRGLSLLAALVSLIGCSLGPLGMLLKFPGPANVSLVFFGVYCLLIGYLILRSTFLPRFVGALMVFAGLGWLTFASPPLVNSLYPYVLLPGLLGEGCLTVWLLLMGVDAQKWTALASAPVIQGRIAAPPPR